MKLPQLVPPKDLLERVQGVEAGLKRGKSVEKAGWGAFVVSAGSVVVWALNNRDSVAFLNGTIAFWPVIISVAVIVVIVMLINWTRIWVRASRKSFRYTYSIAPFQPIPGSESLPRSPDPTWTDGTDAGGEPADGTTDESALPPEEGIDEMSGSAESETGESEETPAGDEAGTRDDSEYTDGGDATYTDGSADMGGATPLAWFVQDLTDRLSRRIGRLSWLSEDLSNETTAQSHIHIEGTYGVRENAQGVWNVEVLPRVRIGRKESPATVAHLVKFTLGPGQTLTPEAYEKLLERLYFSVASHLYGQIRVDVARKINLLPKRYFRASAYFHEAADYARSNTLDAYEQARELYAEVIRLYEPSWWHFSGSRVRRSFQRLGAWWLRVTMKVRARAARFWPPFARAQLMVARAEIGYASMVLNRRTLAGMSGQRLNSVFEARPVAESALARLGELADDTPGYADAWFEANVTLAASNAQLGSAERAAKYLDDAKELDPGRAQTDSRFLHVHGQIVESRRSVVDLHRAVELDSTSDVAQYDLASALEMMWRARTTLERDVAEVVRDEYERVLTVNPGNISAWGNLGYIDWLLGEKEDLEQAARVFERGREYKEIKRETFVSELDYGLARIAAERGDFNEAYRRYIDAAGARFGQGVAHDPGYTDYQFARVTRAVVRRFETYRDRVREKWEELDESNAKDPSERVRNAVYAFVLNDYAEACLNYFLRSANRRYLKKARHELEYAERELKANYPMIYFNLHRILSIDKHADSERAGDFIERVVELQPDWVDGNLERSLWYLDAASKGSRRAAQLEREAEGLGGKAKRHRAQAVVRREKGQSALFEKREQGAGHLLSLLRSGAIEGSAGPAGSGAEPGIGWHGGDHPETRAAPEPNAAPELELPLPLTTPLEDQVAARQLDQEAETIHQRADELRERAQTERAVAEDRERDALRVVRELLPHGWLWKQVLDPETGEPRDELDLSALDNPEFLRTRRWERELDDVHVRALVMWCRLPESADASDRARVLEFVRDHFLPSDYDVLTERSKLVRGGDDAEELREVVKDWVEGEHAWWSLRRVTDGTLFEPAQAAKVLIRVARTDRTLPDGLFLWVAGQLDRLAGLLEEEAKTADAPEARLEAKECAEDCRSEAVNCHRRIRQSALADASVLFKLGDVLLARGDDRAALDAYRAAEEIDKEEEYETHPATTYRRAMAVPRWKLGQYKEALAELTQIDEAEVARDDKNDRVEPWRDKLITDLVDCDAVTTSKAYRLLKDWLGRVLTAHRSDEHVRRDASTALLRLGLLRYHQLERRTLEPEAAVSITNAMSPTVPPVVLEADEDSFFPEDAETPRVQQMLAPDGDIARMRKRIEAQMGIEVPAMQLLSGPSVGPGRYNVILDGSIVATGRLGSESLFATDLEACRRHGLDGREDVDPLDETQPGGLWLAPDADPPAELEIIDRYEYMLRHVEAVLLRNLDLFFGIKQASAVFAKASIASTPESLVRMAAVSRALLREGVPLTDPKAIAREVEKPDAGAVELPALVERVRATLAQALPGADGSRTLVSVRHDIEDEVARWTQRRDGKEFVAVPGAKLAELRRMVDEQVASLEPGAALVVRPRGLRRFVRRVVELDHPAVTVLAFTELPPDVQLNVEAPVLAATPSVEAVA
ncbi:MAG TPA: FHIPEP family type III secretion protein [Gaiellaceae bacterium]|nr:FHIPEP family type III secretion protein [Gaiellaceae bacterium]